MITDYEGLEAWKRRATQQARGRVVLDLEANGLHRYHESLCLIQYADQDGVLVIDPLAIENMRHFSDWLSETEVWMHGADYDMSLFQQAYGVLPAMIWDTQIAARLIGFTHFGLAALVEHYFGLKLSKANQKADWSRRPIPPSMLEYAQTDVKYMLEMSDHLMLKLRELGREDWFVESCEHSLEKGAERFHAQHHDAWRIKGSGKFKRRGLAALRALWQWRDAEAAQWDKPSFMVCSNDELLRWSLALQEFRNVIPHRSFHAHRSARFQKAIERFYGMDDEEYPERVARTQKPGDDHSEARYEYWAKRRNECAAELGIEGSVIASRAALEHIAHDEEAGFGQLMNWQAQLLRQGE